MSQAEDVMSMRYSGRLETADIDLVCPGRFVGVDYAAMGEYHGLRFRHIPTRSSRFDLVVVAFSMQLMDWMTAEDISIFVGDTEATVVTAEFGYKRDPAGWLGNGEWAGLAWCFQQFDNPPKYQDIWIRFNPAKTPKNVTSAAGAAIQVLRVRNAGNILPPVDQRALGTTFGRREFEAATGAAISGAAFQVTTLGRRFVSMDNNLYETEIDINDFEWETNSGNSASFYGGNGGVGWGGAHMQLHTSWVTTNRNARQVAATWGHEPLRGASLSFPMVRPGVLSSGGPLPVTPVVADDGPYLHSITELTTTLGQDIFDDPDGDGMVYWQVGEMPDTPALGLMFLYHDGSLLTPSFQNQMEVYVENEPLTRLGVWATGQNSGDAVSVWSTGVRQISSGAAISVHNVGSLAKGIFTCHYGVRGIASVRVGEWGSLVTDDGVAHEISGTAQEDDLGVGRIFVHAMTGPHVDADETDGYTASPVPFADAVAHSVGKLIVGSTDTFTVDVEGDYGTVVEYVSDNAKEALTTGIAIELVSEPVEPHPITVGAAKYFNSPTTTFTADADDTIIMFVGSLEEDGEPSFTGVTYGGLAMTRVGDIHEVYDLADYIDGAEGLVCVSAWKLEDAPSGQKTVLITGSAGNGYYSSIAAFKGVSDIGNVQFSVDDESPFSQAVGSADDHMVVQAFYNPLAAFGSGNRRKIAGGVSNGTMQMNVWEGDDTVVFTTSRVTLPGQTIDTPTGCIALDLAATGSAVDGIAPAITTSSLGSLKAGQSVSVTLAATGTTPLEWEADEDIPAGLSLSAAGVLSGTPTVDGAYSFEVTVSNAVGSDTKVFSGTIAEADPEPSEPIEVIQSFTTTAMPGLAEVEDIEIQPGSTVIILAGGAAQGVNEVPAPMELSITHGDDEFEQLGSWVETYTTSMEDPETEDVSHMALGVTAFKLENATGGTQTLTSLGGGGLIMAYFTVIELSGVNTVGEPDAETDDTSPFTHTVSSAAGRLVLQAFWGYPVFFTEDTYSPDLLDFNGGIFPVGAAEGASSVEFSVEGDNDSFIGVVDVASIAVELR